MNKTNISFNKPMTFVKDLPKIEEIDPIYVDAFDNFLYEWAESMLPYYAEFNRRDADVFDCENVSTFGKDWAECYEKDNINYRFSNTPLWGKTLSLNGAAGYIELNWKYCFQNKHPEFRASAMDYYNEHFFFNWYFHRYYKKEARYNIITDRLRDYFRYLTGDSEIIFDVGWKSFIYRDPKIRRIIYNCPSFYY